MVMARALTCLDSEPWAQSLVRKPELRCLDQCASQVPRASKGGRIQNELLGRWPGVGRAPSWRNASCASWSPRRWENQES